MNIVKYKNLCWFISSYFYIYSRRYSNRLYSNNISTCFIEDIIEYKDSLKIFNDFDIKLINIFIKGDINELKNEKYEFTLSITNYFIPILINILNKIIKTNISKNITKDIIEILSQIDFKYFDYPFLPKNIFKNDELFNYYKVNYKPFKKSFTNLFKNIFNNQIHDLINNIIITKPFHEIIEKEPFHEIIIKDKFEFDINDNHVSTYINYNNTKIKIY